MIRQICVAALAVAAMVQAASAGEDFVTSNVVVPYGDLDLSTSAGQSVLKSRIDAAALKACGENPAFQSYYRDAPVFARREFARCRHDASLVAMRKLANRGVRLTQN